MNTIFSPLKSILATGIIASTALAQDTPKAPPATDATPTKPIPFAYTEFGKPGEITARKHIKDLDIHQIQFANGLKVNYKQTKLEPNTIHTSVLCGTGLRQKPKDKPGIEMLAGVMLTQGGLGQHTFAELQQVFADKKAGYRVKITDDSFIFSSITRADSLESQLQLYCALLIDSGFHSDTEKLFKEHFWKNFSSDKRLFAIANSKVESWLVNNHHRYIIPTEDQLQKLTGQDVKQWVKPQLESSALEIGIVGDFDEKSLLQTLSTTLGALPTRNSPIKVSEESTTVKVRQAPDNYTVENVTSIPRSLVSIAWQAQDNIQQDQTYQAAVQVLSEIITKRVATELREQFKSSFGVQTVDKTSNYFKNFGFIQTSTYAKDQNLDDTANALIKIGSEIAEQGITEEEFEQAKKALLNTLKNRHTGNLYLLRNVVAASQSTPTLIETFRLQQQAKLPVTIKDVNTIAKKFLTKDRAFTIKFIKKAEE